VTPAIKVINRQRKRAVDLCACQNFADAAVARVCMRKPKTRFPEEIGVFLVSDARISRLHRDYLAIEGPTDVITFHHGEIFISVETAERQARHFSTSFLEEIRLYIVHGLLHLAGFDDSTERGCKMMARSQENIVHEIERAFCSDFPFLRSTETFAQNSKITKVRIQKIDPSSS
jgi:probable rRNA maturation factor